MAPANWLHQRRSLALHGRESPTNRVPASDEKLEGPPITSSVSGARTPWKMLAPSDRAGLLAVNSIHISPDGKAYAYSYTRVLSELYLVDGIR